MSFRFDSPLIPGAYVFGQRGLGLPGAVIRATTASGDSGAGMLFGDLSPADDNSEIMAALTSQPSAGSLFVYEDGSFTFGGAPDGVYSFGYQLKANGASVGVPATVTLSVGAASAAVFAVTTDPAVFSGGVTPGTSGSINVTTGPALWQGSAGAVQRPLPLVVSMARSYQVPTDQSISIYGMGAARPFTWLFGSSSVLDFACDWAAWLAEAGDTLASAEVFSDSTQLLVIGAGITGGTRAAAWVAPVSQGTWPLVFKITTTAGRVDTRTLFLEVGPR